MYFSIFLLQLDSNMLLKKQFWIYRFHKFIKFRKMLPFYEQLPWISKKFWRFSIFKIAIKSLGNWKQLVYVLTNWRTWNFARQIYTFITFKMSQQDWKINFLVPWIFKFKLYKKRAKIRSISEIIICKLKYPNLKYAQNQIHENLQLFLQFKVF